MSTNPKLKVINNHVYASSIDLAEHFNKRHDDVLKTVRSLVSEISLRNFAESNDFSYRNFFQSIYLNKRGKKYPVFNLSRDAFALVAMGFTGKEALEWKIKYINAFNEMESQLRAKQFHTVQDFQLDLFPHFNDEIDKARPAMTTRFAYEQSVRKGIPVPVPETIKEMVKRGELEGYKTGGVYYVYDDAFADYLKNRKL